MLEDKAEAESLSASTLLGYMYTESKLVYESWSQTAEANASPSFGDHLTDSVKRNVLT